MAAPDCYARMTPRTTDDSVVVRVLLANFPARRLLLEVESEPSAQTIIIVPHDIDILSQHSFASLDLGVLATSFCLLRLAKMPELRDTLQKHNGKLPHFTAAGPDVDIFAIPYSDKDREQARQKRLKEVIALGGKNAKNIQAEHKKAMKEQKVKDRRQKSVAKGRNPDKKRGRQAQLADEWEDLAKEERLVKKLRRGKITKEDFNSLMSDV